MKRLYPKMMLAIGGAFLVIMSAIMGSFYLSENQRIESEWLAQAEVLGRMAFETLYASLSHGGGQEGSHEVIVRLQEMDTFVTVRVVSGEPIVEQYGASLDELPQDDLDRRALAGEEIGVIRWEDGHRVARYVTPLRVESECQRCHQAPFGTINGVISAEISLQELESALCRRRATLLLALGGGLLTLGALTFFVTRRLVLRPLAVIQRVAAAFGRGDLDHRVRIRTGDELESLGTEFNRMAEQLQDSYGQVAEERSRIIAAIEATHDAIWISDADQRVIMVNSALARLIGRRREELLGLACSDLLDLRGHDGESICETACPAWQGTVCSGIVEAFISTAMGGEAWVEISYGCVTDASGCRAGMVHIVRDVTQRKEVERLKDEFIFVVSHELRTPLHHIKGFASTLLQTDVVWDAPTQHDFLSRINREADRLAGLVEKILHQARLESGKSSMEKEWYQVNDLVQGTLQRWHNLTADRQVGLRLAPDLPAICVDGREIEVVLMNLIENAVKYSEVGTPVTVSTEWRGNQVVFTVADHGLGIAEEHLDAIFERFYRVNGTGRRVPGTGLGLAICKRIVEAHGGRIWVESMPGVGSSFRFSLPVEG